MPVQGTWDVFGVKIPDFGLTEAYLGGGSVGKGTNWNNPAVYQAAGTTPQAYANTLATNQQYANYQAGTGFNPIGVTTSTNQKPATTDPGSNGSSSGGGNSAPPNPYTTYVDVPGRGQVKLYDLQQEQNRLRGEIEGGWNNYLSSLDSMLGDLPNQQKNYEGIANNQYTQGMNDLNAQKQSNLTDLGTQRRKNEETQAKNLSDLTENLRNQYTAGSMLLGTRGVSSPSAQRMYSYALTKEGNKSRGNVLSQSRSIESDIADREAKLNNVVTQESQRLASERDNKILEAANWLQQAQQQIKQMKAQGLLGKGQDLANLSRDLLNQATQRAQYAQQQFDSYKNSLLSWAESNSKNISELKSNMSAVASYQMPGYSFNPIEGIPNFDAQGNLYSPFGYGSTGTDDWRKKLGLA